MTQYVCDVCKKSTNEKKKVKTLLLHDMEDKTNTCWDFRISSTDICESCAKDIGDYINRSKIFPAPEITKVTNKE